MLAGNAFFFVLAATLTAAHPVRFRADSSLSNQGGTPANSSEPVSLDILAQGNKKYRHSFQFRNSQRRNATNPSFMVLGCADHTVPEDTIFGSPGNIFHQDNMANIYSKNDTSADSAVTYAVKDLGVTHVIVMGHYGCSSVAAGMSGGQEAWSAPIRELYQSSNRTEIAKARDAKKDGTQKLEATDPAFVAMVEENIKASVQRMHDASAFGNSTINSMEQQQPQKQDVFVHGLVYNSTSGEVMDLGVSFGPSGKEVPKIPFAAVQGAKDAVDGAHAPLTTTVTLGGETVTVTATPSASSSEAVATTSVKGEAHTITISAQPSGSASSGGASSAPPVTTAVTIEGEAVTVTATPSSSAGTAVVTTSVKGEDRTITVSGDAKPTSAAPPVTTTVTLEGEAVTVTAIPSSVASGSVGTALVTTSVKGEEHTVTVTGAASSAATTDAAPSSSGSSKDAAPSSSGSATDAASSSSGSASSDAPSSSAASSSDAPSSSGAASSAAASSSVSASSAASSSGASSASSSPAASSSASDASASASVSSSPPN